MLYFVTLQPVLCFLLVLVWLDSFSLVKKKYMLLAFLWGGISTAIAMFGNEMLGSDNASRLVIVPILEETIKGLGVLYLVSKRKSAFFIDAAMYGVAVGAGFAFFENILYVRMYPDMLVGTAVVRGFGTAIMHCGAVASTSAILTWIAYKKDRSLVYFFPSMLPAILLHAFYNSLLFPPLVVLVVILFGVTAWMIFLFIYNEKSIGDWLDLELASEVEMLSSMRKGVFSQSRAGKYMLSIKDQFVPERFFDMYCYVQLYMELSIESKKNMMLAEAGISVEKNPETKLKVKEFYQLKKRIGKTGQIALSPLVKMDRVSEWKVESLV